MMERLTGKRVWDEAKQDLMHEPGYKYVWERLNEIENMFGDEYDLDLIRELVKKNKITNPPDMYNKLPQKGQTVWYWDSYRISKGIVQFVEQWSKDHPQKTRKKDFLERYPNAPIEVDGTPKACCENLGYCKDCNAEVDCINCWNTVMEE